MIDKAFDTALNKMKERNWDSISIAIDWHDTMCKSTYNTNVAYDFYPDALRTIKILSDDPRFNLILYTSSYFERCITFTEALFSEHEIRFDFINENPDIQNTEYGDFSKKFYYDILLDDKAGFEPYYDWRAIRIYLLKEKNEKGINTK